MLNVSLVLRTVKFFFACFENIPVDGQVSLCVYRKHSRGGSEFDEARTCGHGARVDQKELRGGGWPGGDACGESVIEVAAVLEHANVEGVWSENCEVMVGSVAW